MCIWFFVELFQDVVTLGMILVWISSKFVPILVWFWTFSVRKHMKKLAVNIDKENLFGFVKKSTKFVQKLRELNKGKHNYPQEKFRATWLHTGPYGTMHDHKWSNRRILEHAGPNGTKCFHLLPYRTKQGLMGPYRP